MDTEATQALQGWTISNQNSFILLLRYSKRLYPCP